MLVRLSSLKHTQVLLNHDRSLYWSLWTFEHQRWDLYKLANFLLVDDAIEYFFFAWLVERIVRKFDQFLTFHIDQIYLMVGKYFLKVHNYERDWSPSIDVGSSETSELRSLIYQLAFPEHQLEQTVLIHQFVVPSHLS